MQFERKEIHQIRHSQFRMPDSDILFNFVEKKKQNIFI